MPPARLEVRMDSLLSFPVGLFHPLQHAGLSRRTPIYRLRCATSTANSRKAEEVRNCLTDEGRPLGTGLQEQVPNHLRRLCSKGKVVNAEGKGLGFTRSGNRQEEDRKGTTVEVSKRTLDDVQNRSRVTTAGRALTIPAYGRSGIRHERWPELAMRQLNGTWEPETPMQTEKPQVEEPRGRKYGCGVQGRTAL